MFKLLVCDLFCLHPRASRTKSYCTLLIQQGLVRAWYGNYFTAPHFFSKFDTQLKGKMSKKKLTHLSLILGQFYIQDLVGSDHKQYNQGDVTGG